MTLRELSLQTAKKMLMRRIPEKYSVFLFGSFAEGKDKRWSDMDIGVWGLDELPVRIRFDLEEEWEESIIPYPLDLVDFSEVSDYFRSHALEKIEIWRQSKELENYCGSLKKQ
jgi:hypothetical protein